MLKHMFFISSKCLFPWPKYPQNKETFLRLFSALFLFLGQLSINVSLNQYTTKTYSLYTSHFHAIFESFQIKLLFVCSVTFQKLLKPSIQISQDQRSLTYSFISQKPKDIRFNMILNPTIKNCNILQRLKKCIYC